MSTTDINLAVTPQVIQYGATPIEIVAMNMGANEKLVVQLDCPDGSVVDVALLASADGVATASIQLLSGIGSYKLHPKVDGCTDATPCYAFPPITVVAQECKVADALNKLQLFCSNNYVSKGMNAELTVLGLPNAQVVLSQSSAGAVKPHVAVTNADGLASFVVPVIGLNDTFIAMQGLNVSGSVVTRTPANINQPANHVDTNEALVITTLPIPIAVEQGVAFPVVVQIQNTTDGLVRISSTSTSGELKEDLPIHWEFEPISSGSTREFTIFVSGYHNSPTTKAMHLNIYGTALRTTGRTFKWEKTVIVNIPPRKLAASLEIVSLLATPSTIRVGETAKIQLTIANTGEADIHDVELLSYNFPEADGQLNFRGVPLAKGSTYVTTAVIRPKAATTYQYTIDGSLISGTAQERVVVGSGELSTTLLVMSK